MKSILLIAAMTVVSGSARADERIASVTIDSVVIAPFDSVGMKWDGGAATAEELRQVSELTLKLAEKQVNKATVVTAITALAFRFAAGWMEPPDAKGTVQMIYDGTPRPAIALPVKSNQYTPRWTGLSWRVALDHDVQIHFVLDDHDPEKKAKSEHIGTAVIDAAALREAAAVGNGKPYSITVADQANGGILAINVRVVMEQPQVEPVSASQVSPDWYKDPNDVRFERWWDGRQWTSNLRWWNGQQWVAYPN